MTSQLTLLRVILVRRQTGLHLRGAQSCELIGMNGFKHIVVPAGTLRFAAQSRH